MDDERSLQSEGFGSPVGRQRSVQTARVSSQHALRHVFKTPPCFAGLNPGGRDVAKDMVEGVAVPLARTRLVRCLTGEEGGFKPGINKKQTEGDVLVIRYEGSTSGPGRRETMPIRTSREWRRLVRRAGGRVAGGRCCGTTIRNELWTGTGRAGMARASAVPAGAAAEKACYATV